jgi:hypothetical protein
MSVKPRVFVSYSSADHAKAETIREALEAAGLPCWIAPRDLTAGTHWGAGIVEAIEACEVVLVVFSQASNGSPQVAREMEIAVSRRRPLIPVRVADDKPTDDMQYFLGVSHWFDAYAQPIETYLPDIVASVRRVLAGERRPWANLYRRLPKTRSGQIGLSLVGAVVVAAIVAFLMRPHFPGPMKSPLTGRWETKIADGKGGTSDCVMDVQASGMTSFSSDCPDVFSGATGALTAVKDGTFAPNLFQAGDQGTFLLQGGAANGYTASFRLGLFGGLQTRDAHLGVIKWSHVSGDKPLNAGAPAIVPAGATWPLSDTPALAQRATAYVRSKWRPDAVLMSMDLKPDAANGIAASFTFYSADQQQVMVFMPGGPGGDMMPPSAAQQDVSQAIPAQFRDLPDAIDRAHQFGMQGKQIAEAKLEWSGGPSCGTGNFAIDNAILPKCPPNRFIGIQWEIDSALGERSFIPAG